MKRAIVQVDKDTVRKTADPDLMRVEVEKTRRASEIGKECGLFRVPEVLDFDEAAGTAVFERLSGTRPFISSISKGRPFVDQVGRCLAIIHRELSLPSEMIFPLPPEMDLAGTEVFIHGDFNGENVCLYADSQPIAIIDWQTTILREGKATYGSRYFDLLWFINYLIWAHKYAYFFSDPVVPMARTFLQAYFMETDISYDPEAFASYAKDFFVKEVRKNKKRINSLHRYLFYKRGLALKESFIESLSRLEI